MTEEAEREERVARAMLPCPFCGAGRTDIEERPLNRMPNMDGKPSPIISATVRHWCPAQPGQPAGLNISMHGRDRDAAVAAWNRRAAIATLRESGWRTDMENAPHTGRLMLFVKPKNWPGGARSMFGVWDHDGHGFCMDDGYVHDDVIAWRHMLLPPSPEGEGG